MCENALSRYSFQARLLEDPAGEVVGVLDGALREPPTRMKVRVWNRTDEGVRCPYNLISFSALSTESDPWQMLRPTAKAKSPRIVPEFISSSTWIRERISRNCRTRGGGERVGSTEHGTTGLDGIQSLPDHGDDGTSGHVLDQAGEEGLALEILVV